MLNFDMRAVREIALPEEKTETRTFSAKGQEWTLTIWADAKENGERFYALTSCLANPLLPPEPLCAELPPDAESIKTLLSGGDKKLAGAIPAAKIARKRLVVENPAHISNLKVLHTVLIDPPLTLEELIEFDARLGPAAMETIFDWAAEVNGLGEFLLQKMLDVKNRMGVEKMNSLMQSLQPASNSSTPFQNKRSKAAAPTASSGS